MSKNLNNMNNKEFIGLETDKKILLYSSQYEVPYIQTKEEALTKLKAKIAEGNYTVKNPKPAIIRALPLIGKAAALILILFGAWYLLVRRPTINVIAERGNQTEYQLPDGTLVSMNADTKVSYNKEHFGKNRFVKLEGEAFFNVVKGNPFIINTDFAKIEILGTSFNVFARELSFKVTCFTGKIRVTHKNRSIIVEPGESAVIESDFFEKIHEKDMQTIGNWRNGEFHYENVSLNKVFNEIERQFNVTFVLPDVNKKYFTGMFTNKNLVNTLDIVCIPMGLTYEIGTNSKIYIREKLH
jgi:ferric-dicitrate binding protein FerR (iron transport regulator)